jgi:methyl-accepting chemotaxis protein
MNFAAMKLSTKLIGGFLTVCLLGAVVSSIGIHDMSEINDRSDALYHRELIGLSLVKEANADLLYVGRQLRNGILAPTEEQKKSALETADSRLAQLHVNLETAKPLFYTDKGKAAFADLEDSIKAYSAGAAKLRADVAATKLGENGEATQYLFGDFGTITNKVDVDMKKLSELKESNARDSAEENFHTFTEARDLMIGLVIGSMLMGVAIGVWLTRSLTRQLGGEPAEAAQLAHSVAKGDLCTEVKLRAGDTDSVMAALKSMQANLVQVVSKVRSNSESVATASSQIAQGNQDLSQRTEEQASALQETAASMEQLSATVKHNAANAVQGNQLALAASAVAVRGGEVVGQVVGTMKAINESSKRIADIISVIDGIAFQTNILALNAAVEAARAGEQGRGFAVVATEVRNLAGRSADAAKEIKSLISSSVERVEQGTALVDQAGETMTEVVGSIRRVTDIMGEISAASAEQSSGVTQVGTAVSQMDQVTQQNAALVEESAAAAESLKSQAQQLVQAVAVFKLSQADSRGDVVPAQAPESLKIARAVIDAARKPVASRANTTIQRAAPVTPSMQTTASADTGSQDWASF